MERIRWDTLLDDSVNIKEIVVEQWLWNVGKFQDISSLDMPFTL
jgi:hypothetical protein